MAERSGRKPAFNSADKDHTQNGVPDGERTYFRSSRSYAPVIWASRSRQTPVGKPRMRKYIFGGMGGGVGHGVGSGVGVKSSAWIS